MTRRPTLRLWVLVPALALVLAGCGDKSDGGSGGPELVSEGQLINCTHLPYKPFEYEENGDVVGFDINLVKLVADKLGVEQEIVDTPFDGLQSGADFNSGKCDIASSGMTITDERKQNIDFSDPYFEATQALVTKKGSGIEDITDLSGKKLGAANSSTGYDYANENAEGAEVVNFEDLGLLLTAVESGQVDAAINDSGVLYGWVKDLCAECEVVTEFDTGEQYGLGIRKGNTALLDVVNDVLADAKTSGEYDRIYEKWFGSKPPAK